MEKFQDTGSRGLEFISYGQEFSWGFSPALTKEIFLWLQICTENAFTTHFSNWSWHLARGSGPPKRLFRIFSFGHRRHVGAHSCHRCADLLDWVAHHMQLGTWNECAEVPAIISASCSFSFCPCPSAPACLPSCWSRTPPDLDGFVLNKEERKLKTKQTQYVRNHGINRNKATEYKIIKRPLGNNRTDDCQLKVLSYQRNVAVSSGLKTWSGYCASRESIESNLIILLLYFNKEKSLGRIEHVLLR